MLDFLVDCNYRHFFQVNSIQIILKVHFGGSQVGPMIFSTYEVIIKHEAG